MSNQITMMKTSTIVAITVGTLVTGFLGMRCLNLRLPSRPLGQRL
jgi:hypothetical protein